MLWHSGSRSGVGASRKSLSERIVYMCKTFWGVPIRGFGSTVALMNDPHLVALFVDGRRMTLCLSPYSPETETTSSGALTSYDGPGMC